MGRTKKTVFNCDWNNPDINPEWSDIIVAVKTNQHQAACNVCKKK
jgi:hypothetical protein